MSETKDWLEQTWEIKRQMAERYAGMPASEQVADMNAKVIEEWRKRGWTLRESVDASCDVRPALAAAPNE